MLIQKVAFKKIYSDKLNNVVLFPIIITLHKKSVSHLITTMLMQNYNGVTLMGKHWGTLKQKPSALFSLSLVIARRPGWPGIALLVGQRVGFLSNLPLIYRGSLFGVSKYTRGQSTSKSRADRTQTLNSYQCPFNPTKNASICLCVSQRHSMSFFHANLAKLYLSLPFNLYFCIGLCI